MLGLGFSFVFSPKGHISNGEGQSFPALGHLRISPADAKEKQLFLVEKEKKIGSPRGFSGPG